MDSSDDYQPRRKISHLLRDPLIFYENKRNTAKSSHQPKTPFSNQIQSMQKNPPVMFIGGNTPMGLLNQSQMGKANPIVISSPPSKR